MGDRLGLDALGGVYDEDGAFTCLQGALDLVGKIDVPGRVDEVHLIVCRRLAVRLAPVNHAHGAGFDRDTLFALQVHGVEQLLLHLPVGNGPGVLDQAIGQCALAMVNVGYDTEVAYVVEVHVSGGTECRDKFDVETKTVYYKLDWRQFLTLGGIAQVRTGGLSVYPSLPLGPLSLPTAQILAIVAAWFGLSVMARVGRRLRLDPDMIWNLGTIAFAAGVIVARLSHAVQFWSVYRAEPLLLISIRPGGLLLWPGVVGSLVAAYLYLIRVGADPRPVGVAAVFGLLAGGVVLEVSNFLTGAVVGTTGVPPGALSLVLAWMGSSYDTVLSPAAAVRHPVALYRAVGMMAIVGSFLLWGNWRRPGRLAAKAVLALALLRLVTDGFAADSRLLGTLRASQVAALLAAAGLAFMLAQTATRDGQLRLAEEQEVGDSLTEG